MNIAFVLLAATCSACAWSQTQREEFLGVACELIVKREGDLGSTPRLPIGEVSKDRQLVFAGRHHNSEATIVYRCSADTDKVAAIMIYLPLQSEAEGMALIDTEVGLSIGKRFRVCYDTNAIPSAPATPSTPRVVNMRRDENVEYSLQLSSGMALDGEFQVNIRISRPSPSGLVDHEIPRCGEALPNNTFEPTPEG
jgi:hypothetical protein